MPGLEFAKLCIKAERRELGSVDTLNTFKDIEDEEALTKLGGGFNRLRYYTKQKTTTGKLV